VEPQIKTPFSGEFMATASLLVKAGLIPFRSSREFSKGSYAVPLSTDKITAFGSKGISPTHQFQLANAIDFFVPEGTEVMAAASGKVVGLRATSNEGGMALSFWDKGNYLDIWHPQFGEYTWYEHLMFNEILVRVGDVVKEGQVIARSGNTGFSDKPHLHFQVNRYFGDGPEDYVTVKARLKWAEDPYKFND
jgi:murein DD-endopeptidase MepM/ murein hydrolase activator NlpD